MCTFSLIYRAEYNPQHDLLEEEFKLKGRSFHRKDIEVYSIYWVCMLTVIKFFSTYFSWILLISHKSSIHLSVNNLRKKLIAHLLKLYNFHKFYSIMISKVIGNFLQIKNGRGLLLKCSHYVPRHFPEGAPLPCVIYCHGNR